jgi:hypothetical protein
MDGKMELILKNRKKTFAFNTKSRIIEEKFKESKPEFTDQI